MQKNISDSDNGIREFEDIKMAHKNIKNILKNLKETKYNGEKCKIFFKN